MGGKVALAAYVGMCLVIAGCALYWTASTSQPPPRPVLVDEERARARFREDVTNAVRAAFAESNGTLAAPKRPVRKAPAEAA